MLPKLAAGFILLTLGVAVAACSNLGQTTGVNVGPNFGPMTLYATNSNQNAISIYTKGTKSGGGPTYNIGGGSTTLDSPQYLAFDRARNIWVDGFNPGTGNATLIEFSGLATGNVLPLTTATLTGHPRGIAITPKTASPRPSSSASPIPSIMVIADVDPTIKYPSQLLLFSTGATTPFQAIAGPRPRLNIPVGVAIDNTGHIYVANVQGGNVKQFMLPTPSPTPKPTPTPTTTPSPSPTPSGSPSPSPTPSPTPTPINILPNFTLAAANEVIAPTGVALDTSGFIYIVDRGTPQAKCAAVTNNHSPAILVFPPFNKKIPYTKPIRKIQGCATLLNAPTDIKVDSTTGLIYVADSTTSGSGVIYFFPITGHGNIAPMNYRSPGSVIGLGLVP
jgi:hypothetical protein